MHSLNHFLINVELDETLADAARGRFSVYTEEKFDDNNWYTPLALTIKDGKTEISEDNYRGGFDAWIEDRDSWDFDKATEAAYANLYYDINKDINQLTNTDYDYDRKFESIEQAAQTIRETLATSYAGSDEGIEYWKLIARPRLARTYENLIDEYFMPPFFNAWDVNPYNARTFDLTDGEDYGLAILSVDVHT
jgi:hypothetical protein